MDCCRGSSRAGAVSLSDQVWARLLQISLDRVHRHLEAAAAEFGLAPAQAIALHELESDRPMSMRALAARLRCDPSNITGLIDRLEARGLVERLAHPRDRRIKFLMLTPAGQELWDCLAARLYSAPRWLVELPERDQRGLHQLLVQVLGEWD